MIIYMSARAFRVGPSDDDFVVVYVGFPYAYYMYEGLLEPDEPISFKTLKEAKTHLRQLFMKRELDEETIDKHMEVAETFWKNKQAEILKSASAPENMQWLAAS